MTTTLNTAAPPEATFQGKVQAALLDMAYRRLRMSMLMSVFICLLFVVLLWPFFPSSPMVWWMAVLLSTALVRYGLWSAYRRAAQPATQHQRWHWLFALGAAAGGLSWAFGAVTMMPAAGRTESLLLVLPVLSVCAVSVTAMASHKQAMLCFQITALLPTVAALFATGGQVESMAAAVLFAGMACLIVVGWASSAATLSLVEAELRLSLSVDATNLARERAEAASLAKTRFLANMSHELRTPLNAVIGAAQLMRADDHDADQRAQLVDAIQHSGAQLLGLIENVLDLSRIEAGELTLLPQDFHLLDCVDTALATAGMAARAKGLQLACIVAPELPAWRHADDTRVRQVLVNLLDNAVKFTAKGEIVVRVAPGAGKDDVQISVSDTGIGINPAALAHIFQPFRQADDGAQRRFGGSSLDLTIVQQLVEAMGGQIGVKSTLGRGSVFECVLPLLPAKTVPDKPLAQRHRVLYFEPHEPSAQALHAQFERLGCPARRCRNAAELHEWFKHAGRAEPQPWLLVNTDVPEASELLAQAATLFAPARMIGMSSAENSAGHARRPQLSLPRSITKPVLRAALASRLVASPDVSKASDAAPLKPLTADAPHATTHVLVVEDDALNQTIVCRLLRHAGYRVSAVNDGQGALAALRDVAYYIVLMDWQMPDMDGLEVTRRVRVGESGAAASQVPIVALTANAFAEDRDACLAAGMNDFLTKPVMANQLRAAIERWALRPKVTSTAAPTQATVTPAAAPPDSSRPPVFDPALLDALPMVADGSDPGYGQELLDAFMSSVPASLTTLRQAAARGEAKTVLRLVHTLKSSSAAVGALALAARAEAAENELRDAPALPETLATQLHMEFERLQNELEKRRVSTPAGAYSPC